MESTIVIKVKYGDTLRRFSARVLNEQLDINTDGLRRKIFSLFNFAPDTELKLTYIDEDGDVVTLVDDEDLCDVVRQALNPLRIMVSLTSEKSSEPLARASGSCTPLLSPGTQHSIHNLHSAASEILKSIPEPLRKSLSKHLPQNLNYGASDILKSVPEPLLESLLKFSSDLALKATSAAPNLTEVVDSFSKLGLSYMNQLAEVQEPSKGSNGSNIPEPPVEVPSNAKSGEPSAEIDSVFRTSKLESLVEASGTAFSNLKQPTDGNIPPSNMKDVSNHSEIHPNAARSRSGSVKVATLSSTPTDLNGGIMEKSPGGFEDSSACRFFPSQMNECPFTGLPTETCIPQPSTGGAPCKRSYGHADGIFHTGVRCDGCGVHPITGPRFKSKVKEDYDLCSICFAEVGNGADYMRIDRPMSYHRPLSFRGLYDHRARVRPPTLPHILRSAGVKSSRPKLDSRFIRDVNILDGTIMAPSSWFIKVWRMRNNGNIAWPQGSQLVWIGGDKLTDVSSVGLEIAAAGFPVGQELDVTVGFVAPELPGRYISYWRMASPTGQKFGQRVWVLIQVDASMKERMRETIHGFNLNWPPASDSVTGLEVGNTNLERMEDNSVPNKANVLVETGERVDEADVKEHEVNFPINNSLLVGVASNPSPSVPSSSSLSCPIIDLTEEVNPAALSPVPPFVSIVPESSEEVKENIDVEDNLLKELEEMGFKQVDLNKKVLRMNHYDLEQSVDDLCGVSEWDPLLEELDEMGFCNKETNVKLLKKNNGSIKRVVMDLISGRTV